MDKKSVPRKMNSFIVITFSVFAFLFVSFQIHHYLDIRSYYLTKVQRISQSISDSFHFYYHNVQNIALHESVINNRKSSSVRYFDSMIALYPQYEFILLTDTDGKLLAINSIGSDGKKISYKALRGEDLSQENWFVSLKKENETDDIRKGIFGSDFQKVSESNFAKKYLEKSVYGNYFSTSVMDDNGELKGYLTTFVNHDWIESKAMLVDDINSFMKQDLYVVGKNNEIIGFGRENDDLLKKLPFELKTSNLTKSLFSGDIISLFKGVEIFWNSPLFISSQFRHSNFLDKLNWKLILKVDKLEFFKDFLFKFLGFMILFGIWVLFVKQIQYSFLKTLNSYDGVKEDVEIEKRVFFQRYYQKSFDSYSVQIQDLLLRLKEIQLSKINAPKLRNLEIQDPYEKFVETSTILEQTKEAFLKYQAFTDNENFFTKELESYLTRSQEDLETSINEMVNLKRELLNIQVQYDLNESSVKAMELAVSRVEMLLGDLTRGLDNVQQRNLESRIKKATGWGELKGFVYNKLFSEMRKFSNITEDQVFFQNDMSNFNSISKDQNEKLQSQLNEMNASIEKFESIIREFEELTKKQHLDQDAA